MYHRAIKMKPIAFKASRYFGFDAENNDEDPIFKASNSVKTSKYKNIFDEIYIPTLVRRRFCY